MKQYIILFMLIVFTRSHAQQLTEISSGDFIREMRPVIEKMNQDNSKLRFKKEVYRDARSNELLSSSVGVIYHGKERSFRMEDGGVTIMQTNDIYLVVDSLDRVIQLAEPDTNFNPSMALMNLKAEALEKFQLSSYKNATFITYKVVPENLMDGTIEYQVDLKSNMIYRFKISYPAANYFSEDLDDETVEEPYAVITYEPLEKIKDPQKLFDLKQYIVPDQEGKYKLSDQLVNYELYDSRYHPIK